MRKLSVLVALVVILTVGVLPTAAITGGVEDGDAHPNVGAIVIHGVPGRDPWVTCSGTLIHEQILLTAGHCTDYFEYLVQAVGLTLANFSVSFSADDALDPATWISIAEIITHGDYWWGPTANPRDVGALILGEPTGITPATLAREGFLDELKAAGMLRQGRRGAKFTLVGYGSTLEWPPPEITPGDGVRRRAESEYLKLLKAWLVMSQNQATDDGGTCSGDSGGPAFYEGIDPDTDEPTQVVVGITSWGDMPCVATGINYRVDIPDTLDFVDEVISGL